MLAPDRRPVEYPPVQWYRWPRRLVLYSPGLWDELVAHEHDRDRRPTGWSWLGGTLKNPQAQNDRPNYIGQPWRTGPDIQARLIAYAGERGDPALAAAATAGTVTVTEIPDMDTIVGAVEIAQLLHVERGTVDRWRQRDLFPEPDTTVGGRPAWTWYKIENWAIQTRPTAIFSPDQPSR